MNLLNASHTRIALCLVSLISLLSLSLAGCGSSKTVESPTSSNLAKLSDFYSRCTYQQRGKPPANEAELRQFISSLPESETGGNIDDLFRSSRDNEPYVMHYGKDVIPTDMGKIIGHETTGANGKRYVAYDGGLVEEMDEATFAETKKKRR